MECKLHKEELQNIVALFESLSQDNYKFSDEIPIVRQYHKGKGDAYNIAAERIKKHIELLEELA